jgi:hypothetical protein
MNALSTNAHVGGNVYETTEGAGVSSLKTDTQLGGITLRERGR